MLFAMIKFHIVMLSKFGEEGCSHLVKSFLGPIKNLSRVFLHLIKIKIFKP